MQLILFYYRVETIVNYGVTVSSSISRWRVFPDHRPLYTMLVVLRNQIRLIAISCFVLFSRRPPQQFLRMLLNFVFRLLPWRDHTKKSAPSQSRLNIESLDDWLFSADCIKCDLISSNYSHAINDINEIATCVYKRVHPVQNCSNYRANYGEIARGDAKLYAMKR